ncbi:Threonine/homoserine efflux transporter RhtA [Litoreibacter ascidiaceicola]|uniref:Threonine/homoserine efflux transporter RhtA n=1 Tax=Litoreibacter ascidiaceicola TaxID=1486859 RepID=A0A1M4UVB7_9RHOB|nr:DMT family transporter [Litoreibacter ascidiaceicola]SHE60634.1 Threonine/homoserine efflux transporter RhtA [Litoreibacter ascidiaceicola]
MAENNVARGIALMIAATLMFTLMDVCAKALSTRVDTVQTLWARYTVQMVLVTLIVSPRLRSVVHTQRPGLQVFRAIVLLGTTGFFFFGFKKMSLIETTALMQTAPILIMIGAAVFLGETFGIRRAVAAAVALIGAMIVLRPGTDAFTPYALLTLGGVICYSTYALATRYAGRGEDVWTSLFYTGTVATLVLCVMVPFFWQPLEASDLPYMLGVGLLGTMGQLLLIRALSMAPASLLAPFTYVALIFSSVWGVVFFNNYPDGPVYIGALVIVGAGLYVWHRETRVKTS